VNPFLVPEKTMDSSAGLPLDKRGHRLVLPLRLIIGFGHPVEARAETRAGFHRLKECRRENGNLR